MKSVMEESLNIAWKEYYSTVSKSFSQLRDEHFLHDVTLVSDDCTPIPAHKFVLAACSEYFTNVFKLTDKTQPFLCLEGVNTEELKSVLDYVYDGEVKIQQTSIQRFMIIAQRLKLVGLQMESSFDKKDETKLAIKTEVDTDILEDEGPLMLTKETVEELPKKDGDFDDSWVPINDLEKTAKENKDQALKIACPNEQIEKSDNKENTQQALKYPCLKCGKEYTSMYSLRYHMISTHEIVREWPCSKCDYVGKSIGDFNLHVKYHHEGVGHKCDMCDYTAKKIEALARHKAVIHENKCLVCDYKATSSNDLKNHRKTQHENFTYCCNICPYKWDKKLGMLKHLKTHSANPNQPLKNFDDPRLMTVVQNNV